MDKNIGKKLDGRYEIIELIGVGGMADVYKANDILDNKTVAVKILKSEFSENEEFLRRFRNESKAIAVLSHPNIVRVFDVGFTDKIQYIVMEYIDGITLDEYMIKEGRLDWKDAVHYIMQILRALSHAHSKGVVHRDIKPQNIMVLTDGTIKVMDFGIAKFAREEGLGDNIQAIGSVHYISPEQARSDVTDEKSDIYSVGIVMYEMLTGVKPFDTDNALSIALMQMQVNAKPPRQINPDIPEALEEIILKAIEKNPADRYQSAVKMIEDIEKFKSSPQSVFGYYEEENNINMNDKNKNEESNTKFFKSLDPTIYKPLKKNQKTHEEDVPEEKPVIPEDDDVDEEYVEKRSMFIPILSGVSIVVIIVAVCFIFGLLYNYFGGDGSDNKEFQLVSLVGLDYNYVQQEYGHLIEVKTDDNKAEYSSYDKGVILSQDPEAGKEIKPGTTVNVILSKGPKMVNVYSIDPGFSAEQAKALLVDQGFEVQEKWINSDSVEYGNAISTTPEGGFAMKEGSCIVLYISRGPVVLDVDMPDLIGKTQEEATKILEDRDLKVLTAEISSDKKAGTVAMQSHSANQKIKTDTEVTIWISNGQPPQMSMPIEIPFPVNAHGIFTFRAYIDGTLSVEEANVNADYTQKKTLTLVSSGGKKDVRVTIINQATNQEAEVCRYEFSFDDNKTKKQISDTVQEAFESVGGIQIVTTPPVTTPPAVTTTPAGSETTDITTAAGDWEATQSTAAN
ncbi:MAG: Stk1 family PASTA domain-containing Ser/Thr kinase [Oscillospiraceae bacterium]|nr:Stk1 family PASTA domain-containing Ser/Thr kinase [Oscillospiraceae bacterium]